MKITPLARMARACTVAVLACASAVHAADVKVGNTFPPAARAALDAALDQSFAASKAPGAVVGIWVPGEGTYIATRGYADRATKQPMRVDDHFRIGSNTKTFTATLLLILADEKKLSLDDPVSKYEPWVPNGQNMTLRMLADMTAGIPSYSEDDNWVKLAFSNYARGWTPRELVEWGLKTTPSFPPGKGWHYSNTNYVLLGMILEKVSGMKIEALLKQKIYTPLGLTQTSFPSTSAMPVPFARGITAQSLDNTVSDATTRNPSWGFTAGQMISNLADMHTWVVSYTTGTLVSPQMQQARLTWVTLPPNTPDRRYGMGIGDGSGWLGHTGELPGYNTAGYYLPGKKATIVVLVNSDIAVGNDNPAPLIFKALAAVVAPENAPK